MTLLDTFPLTALPRRFLLASVTAFALLGSHAHAAEKLPVTASFSILGDLVRVVGGDRVAVTTLVGANEDAHVFEAKPSDAKTLLASKLVVLNGLGFEPWAGKLLKSSGYKGETVTTAKGVKARAMQEEKGHGAHAGHAHEEMDPHAWQNPNNVALYVRNIAAGLAKVDAAGAATYQANAEAYVKELQALDAWAQAQIATIPADKRKVITSHDAFSYMGKAYDIRFIPLVGVSSQAEPSARDIATIIQQARSEQIQAIFVENTVSAKLVEQVARETGAKVGGTLYSDALGVPGSGVDTYLGMMRSNTDQLIKALRAKLAETASQHAYQQGLDQKR